MVETNHKLLVHSGLYFRSKDNGSWDDLLTWEQSLDEVSWVNAVQVPWMTDHVKILNHVVTLTRDESCKNLEIESGGDLINSSYQLKLFGIYTINAGQTGKQFKYGVIGNLRYTSDDALGAEIGSTDLGLIPNDIIFDGCEKTLTKDLYCRGNIQLLNGAKIIPNGFNAYHRYIGNALIFKSVQSGLYDELSTWEQSEDGVSFVSATRAPAHNDDIWVEEAHQVICQKNESCRDLFLNIAEDINRLDTSGFDLEIWGIIRTYSGAYESPVLNSTGNASSFPALALIRGIISFKCYHNRSISEVGAISADHRLCGWTCKVNNQQGLTIISQTSMRMGHLHIESGNMSFPGSSSDRPIIDVDSVNDGGATGTVVLKSGTYLNPGRGLHSGGDPFASLTIYANAELDFQNHSGANQRLAVQEKSIEGIVSLSASGGLQKFPINDLGGTALQFISKLRLANETKQLLYDVLIEELLVIDRLGFTSNMLDLNGYELTYAESADLKYTSDATITNELFSTTDLNLMPRDLIVHGIELTLDSNKNIRRNIVLLNGGTINYNGFSITENYS